MLLSGIISWWNGYIAHSPLRRLGHAALVAASAALVAKGLGFVKEVVVASVFGLSGELDVYLVAFVLIGMPLSILLNAIQTALIAHLARDSRAADRADDFGASCLFTLAILALLLPIWLWILPFALPWVASGFSPEKRQALESAVVWLTPYYFITGFNLLGYGALQAKGRFWMNGLLPTVTPLAMMLVILGSAASPSWKIIVIALTVGCAMEGFLLFGVLVRMGLLSMPGRVNPKNMSTPIKAALLLLPGTISQAVGPVVEQAIAAAMGEGSNAALAYGYKLPAALQGILLTAIGITALPYFSGQIGQGNHGYSLHSLNKLAIWLLAGGALLALPLAVFSPEIAALLYQRGAFDAAATGRVAPIQLVYFMQIPFALVAMLGVKTLAALNRTGLLSFYTALGVSLQALLAYALATRIGVSGVAWAALTVSALTAISTYLVSRASLLARGR